MGYRIFHADEQEFSSPSAGDQSREICRLSDSLREMRANIWRYPPGSRGRRHTEPVQEEVFVVLEGRAMLLLGEPAEAVDLATGSVAVVRPGTPILLTNRGDEDATVFIIAAPPDQGRAEYLPDAG